MGKSSKKYKLPQKYLYKIGAHVRGACCDGRKFWGTVISIRGPWSVVLDSPGSPQIYVTPVGLIECEVDASEIRRLERVRGVKSEKAGRRTKSSVQKASASGHVDEHRESSHRRRDPRQLRLL